jgi:threonylcarbamoyladenosine tRNA methylthiotransferase MtaB
MALNIDHKVPAQEKRRRSQMLLDLSTKKWEAFYKKHIGLDADVLLEHSRMKGLMHGYTDNYIKVEVPIISEVDNRIVRVRLGDFNDKHTALKAIILNNE